ncbi:MAG: S-methyl-5-thioribose-1-phosphate isomerase [Gemmatimonadales bacterium]|nr:S-methyl-5-thioribose-1-phosphate isomerase [Gemmatimonadales bacterium]
MEFRTVSWAPSGALRILDQTLLPVEECYLDLDTVEAVIEAIQSLRVRGAPAIGIAAAMGLVSSLRSIFRETREVFLAEVEGRAERIGASRPTAVNLGWAMERMRRVARSTQGSAAAVFEALLQEAQAIWREDVEMCRRIGEHGQVLMKKREKGEIGEKGEIRVLTHCNTGALATGGIGTALGVVYTAVRSGKHVHVFTDETRPLLQGSRLTAWELSKAGIPYSVLPDSAAASLIAQDGVDIVLVGADRVARNGDTANKVGTYPLALVAHRHAVPFYVVAPTTSFDLSCPSGDEIPIEQRGALEVTHPLGRQAAPEGSAVFNPAFDVTPAELVTGYVTEQGILHPPFGPT